MDGRRGGRGYERRSIAIDAALAPCLEVVGEMGKADRRFPCISAETVARASERAAEAPAARHAPATSSIASVSVKRLLMQRPAPSRSSASTSRWHLMVCPSATVRTGGTSRSHNPSRHLGLMAAARVEGDSLSGGGAWPRGFRPRARHGASSPSCRRSGWLEQERLGIGMEGRREGSAGLRPSRRCGRSA